MVIAQTDVICRGQITKNMLCAKASSKDSCQGDSGGLYQISASKWAWYHGALYEPLQTYGVPRVPVSAPSTTQRPVPVVEDMTILARMMTVGTMTGKNISKRS